MNFTDGAVINHFVFGTIYLEGEYFCQICEPVKFLAPSKHIDPVIRSGALVVPPNSYLYVARMPLADLNDPVDRPGWHKVKPFIAKSFEFSTSSPIRMGRPWDDIWPWKDDLHPPTVPLFAPDDLPGFQSLAFQDGAYPNGGMYVSGGLTIASGATELLVDNVIVSTPPPIALTGTPPVPDYPTPYVYQPTVTGGTPTAFTLKGGAALPPGYSLSRTTGSITAPANTSGPPRQSTSSSSTPPTPPGGRPSRSPRRSSMRPSRAPRANWSTGAIAGTSGRPTTITSSSMATGSLSRLQMAKC